MDHSADHATQENAVNFSIMHESVVHGSDTVMGSTDVYVHVSHSSISGFIQAVEGIVYYNM